MSIASDLLRGNTETIILSLLAECDNYGYELNNQIVLRSGGLLELKEATLYTAFKRLEQQGAITSYWGDETSGARRKYYAITPLGKAALGFLKEEWENGKKIIDSIIGGIK